MNSATSFKLPRFYPILDTGVLAQRNCALADAADALLAAGVRILQYRHKAVWTQHNFDEAKKLNDLCREAGVLFVLNDRADFAAILQCALHIGQEDLPPAAARKIVADEVIGFSTHNAAQLKEGDAEAVEYLSIGPIFATASKLRPDPVVGVEGIKKLRPLTAKPLCAIGGITLASARKVLAAEADSLAIVSGILPEICDRKSLKARAAEWLAATLQP